MEFKSQVGQDEWVCKMLNNKRNGYFLDIGACDGVFFSNTWYLEKELGWSGVCVEPSKTAFLSLDKERECICLNAAVYNRTDTAIFHEYKDDIWRGHIDTVGYEVPCISFIDLLERYESPHIIDYISIDIEGLEYEILTGFPFGEYKSRLWSIEHNSDEKNEKRDKVRKFMGERGYPYVPLEARTCGFFEDWFYDKERF